MGNSRQRFDILVPAQALWAAALMACALVASTAGAAHAQTVRGTVVDVGAVPVPGVMVQLLGDDSTVVAHSLTDAAGRFLVAATRPGSYRVRTLRIGFRPVISAPIALGAAQEVGQKIQLASVSLGLDTVRVGGRNACGRAVPTGGMTIAVWEQARAAMAATRISSASRDMFTRRVIYDQTLDAAGWRTLKQSTEIQSDALIQPWHAETPENLHKFGYIVSVFDSTVYRAPGLEMLGSSYFFEDHCFRLTNGRDRKLIGLEFTPTPERRNLADVRGTIWLDRESAELRQVEFRYVYPDNPDMELGARGTIDFVRMRNGAWAVSQWNIRMPVLEMANAGTRVPGRRSGAEAQIRVANVQVAGGELALAVSGRDTLFARPPLMLHGTVVDSVSGDELTGARVALQGTSLAAVAAEDGRFVMPGVLPGEYALVVRTPGLDSLGTASETSVTITDAKDDVLVRVPSARQLVASVCGTERPATAGIPGIIVGQTVGPDDTTAPPGTTVSVEWTDAATGGPRAASLPTDANGNFRICGLPTRTAISLRAATDSLRSEPQSVVLAPERPVESVRLPIVHRAAATAVFTGLVMADSGASVVNDAEVIFPDVPVSVHSSERGAFRLRDVPVGTHRVIVRKFGYGPLNTTLTFAANETVDRRIVLSRMTILNEVVITASARRLAAFEEHRALGLGKFFSRDFLETQEGRTLSSVFGATTSLRLEYDRGASRDPSAANSAIYIASTRHCIPVYDGSSMTCAPCYAHVIVDGMVMTRSDRFDINSIRPEDVEAIEYYRGPSEAPGQYQMTDSKCGLVVIHTRQFRK
ncbi:MAG: carboxypeptidase regulatory-like domain-containing protein [Gemmatimonadetes bacterium]|nr:carboxypeptidase regulatory-like domain-containing protein [Gemmatimonadota bacterium]